ncbi:phage tail protein [Thiomicrorhabdus cannonii]|uniref:phage tail protein n=1 Tax=Thiomicrorhabdus cannonii TaxID=2748011 RepID=UPI0015C14713|nr:phage tail protein [Thiomicrorhabdus cannonii]
MNYYMKLTETGVAKIAASQMGGDRVSLTEMAVGDGDGNEVGQPVGDEITLVREVYRTQISSLYANPNDSTQMMAEMVIPAEDGGFALREVGIFDTDGDLFAYGNFPETYKPIAAEGSTRSMAIVAAIKIENSNNVQLVIDASIVYATRAWVLNTITTAYLIPGGEVGQVLAKASDSDGDFVWKNIVDDAELKRVIRLNSYFMGQN